MRFTTPFLLFRCVFWTAMILYMAALPTGLKAEEFKTGDLKGLSGIILFSANVGQSEKIFALDLDAQRVRKLIDGPGNNTYPSWSPDGTRFVFASDRDGNSEIYLANWDGTNLTRLTSNNVNDDNPSWGAGASTVVYYSDKAPDGKDSNIVSLDVSSGKETPLTRFDRRNTTPRSSPDGTSVIYSTNRFWPGWDICEWIIGRKSERCLLSGAQTYCRPSFSPDGKYIAYSFGAFSDIDIATFEVATKKEKRITSMPGKEYDVIWSPEGDLLAFTAEDGRSNIFNIYASTLKGDTRPLLLSPHSIRFLSWSRVKTIELEAQRIREQQLSGKEG